jgi:stress response protein YsnF
MSLTADQLAGLAANAHVLDADGRRLGRVRHIYDSDRAGELTWVSIDTDGPGRGSRFVPLEGARLDGPDLRLAYAGDLVDRSPEISDEDVVDSTQEGRLRAHYGLQAGSGGGVTMIRSEQRLAVGTVVEAVERVRVTKYIVTEEVTHTFTLRREEVRVEHVPVSGRDATAGGTGAAFDDGVEEIVLYAEVPVLETRVVPVEVVRVSKHTVLGEERVSADLAREEIVAEQTARTGPPAPGQR